MPATAQFEIKWTTTSPSGALGRVQSTDIEVAADGVVYASGCVRPENTGGIAGLRLTRIESNGAVAWSRLFSALDAESSHIAVSPVDGSITQVGSTYEAGSSQRLVRILHYDSAGNLQWSTIAAALDNWTNFETRDTPMALDQFGNVYVGGFAALPPSGPNPTVMSFDSSGALRFTAALPVTVTSSGAETVDALEFDPTTGAVFIAGHSGGDQKAGTASYVARLTTSGAVTWLQQSVAPTGPFVFARDLAVDGQGRVSVLSNHSPTGSLADTAETRVTRYDALGNPAGFIVNPWSQRQVYGMDVDPLGSVVLCGSSSVLSSPGFVARYDDGLNISWERTVSLLQASTSLLESIELRDGDATASGSYVDVTQLGLSALSVRYSASGDERWVYVPAQGPSTALDFVTDQALDSTGRAWFAIHRTAAPLSVSTVEQVVIALEPQTHSFCHGDGAASACPCGNVSNAETQAGCTNSIGNAAKLIESGNASLAGDSLSFTCSGMGSTALTVAFEGTSTVAPGAFGDGLRCTSGSLQRLYLKSATGGIVTVPSVGDGSVHVRAAALGAPISAGQRRSYQIYYRDGSIAFCPSPSGGAFNTSNALLVSWRP